MCSYTVIIKTSCSSVSYTRDKISIAFGDVYGNEVNCFFFLFHCSLTFKQSSQSFCNAILRCKQTGLGLSSDHRLSDKTANLRKLDLKVSIFLVNDYIFSCDVRNVKIKRRVLFIYLSFSCFQTIQK